MNDTADFEFALWQDPLSVDPGDQVGSTLLVDNVGVAQGLFTVWLDLGEVAFTGDARWLEIAVNGTTLSPRQELTPAPYALYALDSPGSAGFWAASGDEIYNTNAGNVGIGTTNPGTTLHVFSDDSNARVLVQSTYATSGSADIDFRGPGGERYLVGWCDSGGFFRIYSGTHSQDILTIKDSSGNVGLQGDVGIGTASPTSRLHIDDWTNVPADPDPDSQAPLKITNGAGQALLFDSNQIESVGDTLHLNHRPTGGVGNDVLLVGGGGKVGIDTTSPAAKLHVGGTPGTDGIMFPDGTLQTTAAADGLWSESGSDIYYMAGSVGIGTAYPQARLDVDGQVHAMADLPADPGPDAPATLNVENAATDASWGGHAIRATNVAPSQLALTYAFRGTGVWGDENTTLGAIGVLGTSDTNLGVAGITDTGIAIFGAIEDVGGGGTGLAGQFAGDVEVYGSLSKSGGSFKIDHPLDPENRCLLHSFVESPDMMNVYNGNIVTDERGYATIELPEYFEALNRDFRYQLTVVDEADSDVFVLAKVVRKIMDNRFTIRASVSNAEVSWQVTGIRQDAWADTNRIPVEVDKPGQECGTYLHPEAHGVPEELGLGYQERLSRPTEPPNTNTGGAG
ncbi:MAG: hypothetical protein ABIG44_18980 [Planctomycetota bacterium]